MKLDKLGILKSIFKKVPIPRIPEPKLEDLIYPESRILFKLKKNLNYCYMIQDLYSYKIRSHDNAKELTDYHKIFDNGMNFLIHLVEKDSFYRYRVKMALFMLSSDIFLNTYYQNLKGLGFDDLKNWDGKTVVDLKIEMAAPRRDGVKETGIFEDLKIGKWKKIKEEVL